MTFPRKIGLLLILVAVGAAVGYEFGTPGDGGEPEEQQGFCCRWCAAELLHKLERAGAQRRAREEAAPRVDEFDIIDSSEPELAVSIH